MLVNTPPDTGPYRIIGNKTLMLIIALFIAHAIAFALWPSTRTEYVLQTPMGNKLPITPSVLLPLFTTILLVFATRNCDANDSNTRSYHIRSAMIAVAPIFTLPYQVMNIGDRFELLNPFEAGIFTALFLATFGVAILIVRTISKTVE